MLFALMGVGIRLLVMMTIQRRQQQLNRQINERLKTLIAAYKVLGGSFTGNLAVDPAHRRRAQRAGQPATPVEAPPLDLGDPPSDVAPDDDSGAGDSPIAERRRRIRDAVEAALSDIILLGTEEQVRLASRAAAELVAGHPVHTGELVVSLRDFIRKALDLDPIPADIAIPAQGPTRPQSSGGARGGNAGRGEGGRDTGGGGGGGGGGGMGMGLGMGMGMGARDDDATGSNPRSGV